MAAVLAVVQAVVAVQVVVARVYLAELRQVDLVEEIAAVATKVAVAK